MSSATVIVRSGGLFWLKPVAIIIGGGGVGPIIITNQNNGLLQGSVLSPSTRTIYVAQPRINHSGGSPGCTRTLLHNKQSSIES